MANEQDQARSALLDAIVNMAAKAEHVRAPEMVPHYAMAAKDFAEAYTLLTTSPQRRRRPASDTQAMQAMAQPALSSPAGLTTGSPAWPPAASFE